MSDLTRAEAIDELCRLASDLPIMLIDTVPKHQKDRFVRALKVGINSLQIDERYDLAMEQAEPSEGWNNHQIACMLADLFGDACACNFNDIADWLPELCDFKDTCCPNPVGVACWEQFLKYIKSRYTECGYEVRR